VLDTTPAPTADGVEPPPTFALGNGASFGPTVSADGNTIVCASQATNLLQTQTPGGGEVGDGDLITLDRHTGSLRRSFDLPTPAPGSFAHAQLSGNGRLLVTESLAAAHLTGDAALADPATAGRRLVTASYVPSMSMADLDLGTVRVGEASPEWFVNVVNAGPGTFRPDAVSTDNPDFAVTGGTCLDKSPVPAQQVCTVTIVFTPSHNGLLSARVSVAEAGFGAVTIGAKLTGAGGEPALLADPAAATFGTTIVGETSDDTATITVSNLYFTVVSFTAVTFGGANQSDFAVKSTTCIGEPVIEVPLGGTCSIDVSFTPTAGGVRTASLNIATSVEQYTSVLVSGEGVYSPTLVAPESAAPGRTIDVGGTGFPIRTEVVVGWSDGGAPITVTTDDNGKFLTTWDVGRNRHPGESVLVAQVANGPRASVTIDIDRGRRRSSGGSRD
jgi:hypothetical protein